MTAVTMNIIVVLGVTPYSLVYRQQHFHFAWFFGSIRESSSQFKSPRFIVRKFAQVFNLYVLVWTPVRWAGVSANHILLTKGKESDSAPVYGVQSVLLDLAVINRMRNGFGRLH
jgi:hypothetical protein